jgi:hypothetical protein
MTLSCLINLKDRVFIAMITNSIEPIYEML